MTLTIAIWRQLSFKNFRNKFFRIFIAKVLRLGIMAQLDAEENVSL